MLGDRTTSRAERNQSLGRFLETTRLARDTGALQWTVVVAPSTAYSEDTPVLRVANDIVDVVTRRRRAGDESSAITRLAQADGALAWSRELPKLAAGTELAQQMRVMPDGTLAIVRSVGLRDRGQRWLRGSLLDRVDATTGAFVSSHVLSLATDEHAREGEVVGELDARDHGAGEAGVVHPAEEERAPLRLRRSEGRRIELDEAEIARRFPTQVAAVYIRDVTGEPLTAPRYAALLAGLDAGATLVSQPRPDLVGQKVAPTTDATALRRGERP